MIDPTENSKERNQMAARSSLIPFAFLFIVLAVLVMTVESHDGHDHGPAMAPAPHAHHDHDHAMAPAPHAHHDHDHAPAPPPSAATFSAYPQLIVTALVSVLSFVF